MNEPSFVPVPTMRSQTFWPSTVMSRISRWKSENALRSDVIAAKADVLPETVYARFGNKLALLVELVGRAARGTDTSSILEQEGPRAVAAETDQREQLRLFAADVVLRLERVGPLLAVLAGAARAEPELATFLKEDPRGATQEPADLRGDPLSERRTRG